VNYDVFSKYLTWMIERDLVKLVESEDGHDRVLLTGKGEESYRKLVQWMNEVIHGRRP
jgi:predicted transcriptional regulator